MPYTDDDFDRDPFALGGSVGADGANDPGDVIKAQVLLGNTGDFPLDELGAPTGWPSSGLTDGIRAVQRRHGLTVDGVMLPMVDGAVGPNGEGETLAATQLDLDGRLDGHVVPSPAESEEYFSAQNRFGGDGKPAVRISTAESRAGRDLPRGVLLPEILSDPPDPAPAFAPGQQVAFAPAWALAAGVATRVGGPHLPNLLRGLGTMAPAAALPLHGDSPADDQASGAALPESRGPEVPPPDEQARRTGPSPRRGQIVIAEDGRRLQVPALTGWADDLNQSDRGFAEALAAALVLQDDRLRTGGSRGDAWTQQGINITIEECLKLAKAEFPGFKVNHIFGGNEDGGGPAIKEEHVWNFDGQGEQQRSGSRRPDFTFELARNIALRLRYNTATTDAQGNPVPREQAAEKGIRDLAQDDVMHAAPKFPRGSSEADMRALARAECRKALDETRRQFD